MFSKFCFFLKVLNQGSSRKNPQLLALIDSTELAHLEYCHYPLDGMLFPSRVTASNDYVAGSINTPVGGEYSKDSFLAKQLILETKPWTTNLSVCRVVKSSWLSAKLLSEVRHLLQTSLTTPSVLTNTPTANFFGNALFILVFWLFSWACIDIVYKYSLGIKKYVYELIPKIYYLKTIHRLLLKFIIIFWQTGSSAMNMSCLWLSVVSLYREDWNLAHSEII